MMLLPGADATAEGLDRLGLISGGLEGAFKLKHVGGLPE